VSIKFIVPTSLVENGKMQDTQDDDKTDIWVLTYGDMMSLLLCLFVMLYALGAVQDGQIESAAESLRSSFGLFGTTASGGTIQSGAQKTKSSIGSKNGLTLSFDAGQDELSDDAKKQLGMFAQRLAAQQPYLVISGRVAKEEPLPYRRNVDLAYSRAIAVWDYLVAQGINKDNISIQQETEADLPSVAVAVKNR
jgi:chemotaxis protein MotB